MNVLEDFWYGNINPQEQSKDNNRDHLQETMTPEQQVILEKYDDCVNEMYGLIEAAVFAYAFRLGGRLMLATLLDDGVS